jgi:hypothetical protein
LQNNITIDYNIFLNLFCDILIYTYNINYRKYNVFNIYNYLNFYLIVTYKHNNIAISNIICLLYIIILNILALTKILDTLSINLYIYIYIIFLQKIKVLLLIIYKDIYVQILFCINNKSFISFYIIYNR